MTSFDIWFDLIGQRANVSPVERLRMAFEAGAQSNTHTPLTTAQWLQTADTNNTENTHAESK